MKARSVFAVLVALPLILTGCAGPAFKQAKALNTVTAYDKFLQEYPQSQYAEEARQTKEQLFCEEVNVRNTVEGYNSYLDRHPKGTCSAEVLKKLEPLLWKDAEQKSTISSYDGYLKKYQNGIYVAEAKEKRERLFCDKVKQENTGDGYSSYIDQYPDGICAAEVKQKLELIVWKSAEQKGATEAYDLYLKKYPTGVYFSEAQAKRTVSLLIEQLRDSKKETREEASNKLSKMGRELSEAHVNKMIDVMRNGSDKWREFLYKGASGHCSWYEQTSVKYYAANALTKMESPYVTTAVVSEAKTAKTKGKGEKYRVDDPGWR
jgi:outer membrane protein assembly factor BamD (BamD/ComL family)